MSASRIKLIQALSKFSHLNQSVDNKAMVIFGAGNTSVLYQKCLVRDGIFPKYYIDNNPQKQGTFLGEIEVISPCLLCELWLNNRIPEPIVFICSAINSTVKIIQEQLKCLGLTSFPIDSFIFSRHIPEILEVYDCLEDDFSKETYAEVIISRLKNTEIPEHILHDNQYFAIRQFRIRSDAEVFVDAGAYVGDDIEKYLSIKSGVFRKIYAFEPERRNYYAMQQRVDRLSREWAFDKDRIEAVFAGVGERSGSLNISSQKSDIASLGANFCATPSPESEKVDIYSLDDYFASKTVSFIKADIESFEYDMLQGAIKIIQRDKPLLAICIYHSASDMYAIPLLVKKLLPEYKLSIRHHYSDNSDTVLYAY